MTLTAPAPAGGARIRLLGSMGEGVVVPQDVTVPAGSLSASFPITPPKVARPNWVLIQAAYDFVGSCTRRRSASTREAPVRRRSTRSA